MGLFDSIQDLIGGASDAAQGSLGDIVGGITDNQALQDLQDQATNITDGASSAVTDAADQAQNAKDNIVGQ